MKRTFKSIMFIAAAAMAFTACNAELVDDSADLIGGTHTVKFVATQDVTKTTMDIKDGVASFAWENTDNAYFHIFENGVGVTGDDIDAELVNGVMNISAVFPDSSAPYTYTGFMAATVSNENPAVSNEQIDLGAYDPESDILVAKPVTDKTPEDIYKGVLFQFKRVVAINQMTIKGLTAGEIVTEVTITSDKPIAGEYDFANGAWKASETSISITAEAAANTDGQAVVYFVSAPVEGAQLTITATTEAGKTYSKKLAKTISFAEGGVKVFGVTVEEITPVPETKTIEINLTKSGVTGSYSYGTFDIDDVTFGYNQWMKSTDFIQAKASTPNSLYNIDPIPGRISKVTFVTGSGKTARAIIVYGGNSSRPDTKITAPDTDQTMVFDFADKDYNYFSMNTPSNACYFEKIIVEYVTGPVKNLTSLAVSGAPSKTSYNVGESFDPAGLVVTGTYDDATTSEITSGIDWTISPYPLTAGTTSVSVVATVGEISSTAYNVDVTVAEVVEKEFTLFTNSTLVEGDYIIYYGGKAMKNSVSSNRLDYTEISPSDNAISTSDNTIIWHIAKDGDYWTIYNANVEKYAAGTNSKNQGALIENITDLSLWSCSSSNGKYDFINKGRAAATSDSGNKYLRNNDTYGFACYGSTTGDALTLYRNGVVEKVSVAGVSVQETATIKEGETVTLVPTITPADASNMNVTWSSEDEDVATVANGVVTGVAAGTTTITVTTDDGSFTDDCIVIVTPSSTSIANTLETAYTASEAKALIDDAGKDLSTHVYVKGIVSEIVTAYDSNFGNISFNVSADGATTGDQFQFFRNFKSANNGKWSDSDAKPRVGDFVIGYGKLTKYNSTYEFEAGNYIVSIDRAQYLEASASKTANISAEGETITITVDTNIDSWSASIAGDSTFALDQDNKTATTIPVIVSANNDVENEKTATVTITAGDKTVEINLSQQVKTDGGQGGNDPIVLTFDLSKNPGGWPTANSTTLTNYTYTLDGTSYTFGLNNVKCNSGYLMLTSTAVLGLPAIDGKKLTKVVAGNSGGCSTSTKVGVSSSSSSASYISGGAIQMWSVQSSAYTYTLEGTSNNTVYYLYVTNKNAQITELTLTYE